MPRRMLPPQTVMLSHQLSNRIILRQVLWVNRFLLRICNCLHFRQQWSNNLPVSHELHRSLWMKIKNIVRPDICPDYQLQFLQSKAICYLTHGVISRVNTPKIFLSSWSKTLAYSFLFIGILRSTDAQVYSYVVTYLVSDWISYKCRITIILEGILMPKVLRHIKLSGWKVGPSERTNLKQIFCFVLQPAE